jgi:hypothetical protein
MGIRWPFSPKIKPVLEQEVTPAPLVDEELDRQAGEAGLKMLASVALSFELSGRIRDRLAEGVILELRGR